MGEGDDSEGASQRNVFVSYSRDDRAAALPIIEALEADGVRVWWDGLLVGGDRFSQTTEKALETANAVVVLWTARSIQSHWVRDEATRGRDRGCMISASLDGTEPPLGFRQVQYIDMSDWRGKADAPEFRELVRAIENASCADGSSLTFLPPGAQRRGISRRAALALGGAGVAVLAGAGLVAWRSGLLGGGAEANSIAVLPFDNLGAGGREDYFSDGLSEELRATLSINRQLAVAAQASSDLFRGGATPVREIARKLGVAYVLDGSVRRSSDRLRVTARLVDGKSGFEQWTEVFERTLEDVLEVQQDLATRVADALLADFSTREGEGIHRAGGTKKSKALDAYLRGRALYDHAASEESDRAALGAFEEAVALDPDYAAAHAALSRASTVIGSSYSRGSELAAWYERAMREARRAIELAPDLAEGHSALGFVLMNGRLDLGAASEPYRRSFELGYGNAPILLGFANFATNTLQFDEARAAVARAERLDPLNPMVFRTGAAVEFAAGDYPAASKAARSALSLDPGVSVAHRVLGDIALIGGDPARAREEYLAEPSGISRLRGLALVDGKLSGGPAGEARLAELIREYGDNSLYQQAEVLAQWGRGDEALAALEKGLEIGDSGLVLAASDPLLDPVRQDPRFAAVLDRLSFE